MSSKEVSPIEDYSSSQPEDSTLPVSEMEHGSEESHLDEKFGKRSSESGLPPLTAEEKYPKYLAPPPDHSTLEVVPGTGPEVVPAIPLVEESVGGPGALEEGRETGQTGSDDKKGRRRILGLSVPIFWTVVVLLAVLLAGAIGGGIGGGLATRNSSNAEGSSGYVVGVSFSF